MLQPQQYAQITFFNSWENNAHTSFTWSYDAHTWLPGIDTKAAA